MAVAAATDMYSSQEPPHHASPEGEGTDWGMLKILGGLFAARQRGVEDGAAPPTGRKSLCDNGLAIKSEFALRFLGVL